MGTTKKRRNEYFISVDERSCHIYNAYAFAQALLKLGKKIHFCKAPPHFNRVKKIIFVGHDNPFFWLDNTDEDDFFVNVEPLFLKEFMIHPKNKEKFFEIMQKRYIIDYCIYNKPFLNRHCFYVIPPFEINKYPEEKKYDILFVGSFNKKRENILRVFEQSDMKCWIGRLIGKTLHEKIHQAKFFLNINYYEKSPFNQFRFSLCALTNTLYAGEAGEIEFYPEMEPLIGLTLFHDVKELIPKLKLLLNEPELYAKALGYQHAIAQENKLKFDKFIKETFDNNEAKNS